MSKSLIKNSLLFIGIFLLQVLVFDNIQLGNYLHPIIYVIFILILPYDTPKWKLLVNGFLIGIAVDIFNGTPGLNAAATVLLAYSRPFVIDIMTRKSELKEKYEPTVEKMGFLWFLVYSTILLLIHNFALFMLEVFSFKLLGIVLLQVLISVPISIFLILLISYLFKPLK